LTKNKILFLTGIIIKKLPRRFYYSTFDHLTMNILAIGAHPDDIELGCGGLIYKAVRKGHNVFMYTLTRGAAAGNPIERTKELITTSRFIGANTLWIDDFEDTRLSVDCDLINHIEFTINRSQADIVITHALTDVHHDHKAVAASTIEAGRNIPNIIAYENPLTKHFNPQIFYDISDVVNEKVELIKLFKSQGDKLYLKANAIKGLAEYRALQSRLNGKSNYGGALFDYVEAFEILKLCVDDGFKLWNNSKQSLMQSQDAVLKYDNILEVVAQSIIQ
jgi:LmbE family N-acetylglucosaminyl deacetylase